MSATPIIPADDQITVEIDGQPYKARKGQMIIEVTDAHGIPVPRFCYHSKLPIAANCRMCLVQVEKAPKPLPACATPIADGMKIQTQSDYARKAQKAVMEFLLINHPLDCPICDQGGECELQDLALGYGRDVSRFAETKRVVKDKDVGPLIATCMTRCIHCTRCVRFLDVIAGHRELGGIGRGENVEIGTYVERAIESEMSGNVIDVCPVGALTSKPFQFTARAWELQQTPSVAPHDCVGSNLYLHSRRGEVMRAVPRDNEELNEVWLSDRDRFSYQGLAHAERITQPQRKLNGQWQTIDWETALKVVADGLRHCAGDDLGILASPTATVEEAYLLARIAEGLGCANIDHRLRQTDVADQDTLPLHPWLGGPLADLENRDAVLLVGANPRKEAPIIAHRLRKASLAGARVFAINPIAYDFNFAVADQIAVKPSAMVAELAAVTAAALKIRSANVPADLQSVLDGAQISPRHEAMAQALCDSTRGQVLLGLNAAMHPAASALRALTSLLAETTGARLGAMSDGPNGAGAWLAGAVPHRAAAGAARTHAGLSAQAMLETPRKAYVLFGCEPEADFADPAKTQQALSAAGFVVAMSAFASPALRECAHILLPIAAFGETSGTFVNGEGRWQSFAGAVRPLGEARPGWKVLRVLGNLLDLSGCDYESSEALRDELRGLVGEQRPSHARVSSAVNMPAANGGLERVGDVPLYAVDALVRRAAALQATADGADAVVRINASEAARLGLGAQAKVTQGGAERVLPVMTDARVPDGAVWIASTRPGSTQGDSRLGAAFGPVELKPA
ncbi:MAG: NADH-quinone oxidoreductase subunit G [Gammaproteobacteria bacterium]|nr:NADH-quinone oxidoreductase subunit G [Gammaproteobacteria bacterium]